MSTISESVTAETLWGNPPRGRCELVRGEVRMMSPAGSRHGWVVMKVGAPLTNFVEAHSLGIVFGAETGFIIRRNPDTVRAPDVSFVRSHRIDGMPPAGFFPGPPDLAVEVLSPGDSASEVQEKAEDWLENGCAEVWLIDPRREKAWRCTLSDKAVLQERIDTLTSDMLPGFALPVADLFR